MKIPRTPLLYIVLGFLGGVIIARNSAPMTNPQKGTVVVCLLIGGYILWRAGYKGKSEAVANAVAIATATATATADARAQAVANQAVSIFLTTPDVRMPRSIDPILETAWVNAIDEKEEAHQDVIEIAPTKRSVKVRKTV